MNADVAVIGAGIAGAAAAYEIAASRSVVLLEREDQPGYHSTGRSAALYTENYGNAAIRALTIGSRPFFERPPEGFADTPILTPRGVLFLAREDQQAAVAHLLAEAAGEGLAEISIAEACRLLPVLRPDYAARALHEVAAMDMDVHALHHGFLKGLKGRGGRLATNAEVRAIERRPQGWRLATAAGEIDVSVIVNAAGAWADEVAALAGPKRLGLTPKRRTVLTFDPPAGVSLQGWPMAIDAEETFYFRPEAGRILASPADETPVPPCDVQPEEIDLALTVDRIERATTLKVASIGHKWAGLRSFFPDKTPVAGWSGEAPGFFWLAGQGGYGIMTSPALGRVAAALIAGQDLPADLRALGLDPAALSPTRLGG